MAKIDASEALSVLGGYPVGKVSANLPPLSINPSKTILTQQQIREIRQTTSDYLLLAGAVFSRKLPSLPVRFDLSGSLAGQYRRPYSGPAIIRFNPDIAAAHYPRFLVRTVPHEVAHYVTDRVYGLENIRPHGKEWRQLMQALRADSSRCHDYDLTGIPVRRQQRHRYRCGCRAHRLSSTRHKRVQRGNVYLCRVCQGELVYAGASEGLPAAAENNR